MSYDDNVCVSRISSGGAVCRGDSGGPLVTRSVSGITGVSCIILTRDLRRVHRSGSGEFR